MLSDLINGYRRDNGLPPLSPESHLQAAAAAYAKVVVETRWWEFHRGDSIHNAPDCGTVDSRLDAAGYPNGYGAEAVMDGSNGWTPRQMFDQFIAAVQVRAENPANADPVWIDEGLACAVRPSPSPEDVACVLLMGRTVAP